MENVNSRTFVLICLFMINQYVLGLENNLPINEARFVAERPGVSSSNFLNQDGYRNTGNGLLSFFKNIYPISVENDEPDNRFLDRDDLSNFLVQSLYKKRTASKGSNKQWNQLHGLIGKRDDSKSKHEKAWNQLNSMWG